MTEEKRQKLLIEINGIEYQARDEQEKCEIERMNNKTRAIERQMKSAKVYSLDRMEEEGHPPAQENQMEFILDGLMIEKLRECLLLLSDEERAIIIAYYYKGKSERQIASESQEHYMTIHCKKIRILDTLYKLLK